MVTDITNEHVEWDTVIGPKKNNFSLNLKEIWRYRDLLMLFVKKDIVTIYKQTILGPLWFLIQPLFTSLMYLLIFNSIANIPTGGVPPILFYLLGTTLWSYFSDTLNTTSRTFTDNASIFGKVYFPRLILPLSKIVSGFIKFLIQFSLFFAFWIYFICIHKLTPNWYIIFSPFILLIIVAMGLAFGIIITSLTTKYRDLIFLVGFGVQLAMYITPVIIPLSGVNGKHKIFFLINPLTSLFGTGTISIYWLSYSVAFTLVLLLIGVRVFSRVEKHFIDTV